MAFVPFETLSEVRRGCALGSAHADLRDAQHARPRWLGHPPRQPRRLHEVTREVESLGLNVVAQYALFGQWDFLNIIEAPDEATMAKAAVTLAARGTMRSTTLQALPIAELLAALDAAPE